MKITDRYSLNVFWSDEDQSYICTSSLFPGLMAFGETKENAVIEGEIALEGILQTLKQEGTQIPEPDILEAFSGQFTLRLPQSLHRKLTEDAKREGISLNQLILFRLSTSEGKIETIKMVIEKIEQQIIVHQTNNIVVQNSEESTDLTVKNKRF